MKFTPDLFYQQLLSQPCPAGWLVAYSGGLDSTVLLHAIAELRGRLGAPVGAVHVHHGLQAGADDWERHCQSICDALDIPLTVLHVDARPARGESPEAAAREARYAAIAGELLTGHCLLTAQHRDDQAETLMLQLLRGAGVHGLASMPACTPFGKGTHLRPLLGMSRQSLHDYATARGLAWIEDPSNAETGADRNFLRHEVMPLLKSRWPALTGSLSRSAAHAAEAAGLLDMLAEADYIDANGPQAGTLSVSALLALPPPRQRNVLRLWMRRQGGSAPSTVVLERVLDEVMSSRVDAEPCVSWGAHSVRRYRDELFVTSTDMREPLPREYHWQLQAPLTLPEYGVLSADRVVGQGLRCAAIAGDGVRIGWRRGGETCRPAGRGHLHTLKKLFQEAGIPPWQRDCIPLLYVDEQLAAVAGLWVCEPFQAGPQEPGYRIHWQGVQ